MSGRLDTVEALRCIASAMEDDNCAITEMLVIGRKPDGEFISEDTDLTLLQAAQMCADFTRYLGRLNRSYYGSYGPRYDRPRCRERRTTR